MLWPFKRLDFWVFIGLVALGAYLAYIDNILGLHTILVETVHALVVTTLLVLCLVCQYRYPEVRQFGWHKIVAGIVLLMMASWIDILDDPPLLSLFEIHDVPFGRSWQQAFLKKILGYTGGIALIAYGFLQWIPWMVETRTNVQRLNQRLSVANKNMNRLLMSLDEHVESERLNISRELHDDVAQQLTFLNLQLQMASKELASQPEQAAVRLKTIGQEVSETLKSVRQISRNLRPEPLYALGLVPAMEQFIDKLRQQAPDVEVTLEYLPLQEDGQHQRLESRFNDREMLHIFRLLQEGIRNALKHGEASLVRTRILEEKTCFRFVIEDNGKGLPWDELPTDDVLVQQGHLGIAGMRERVKELSGTFSLVNHTPSGARMEITVAK